jgi:ribosome-associated toxin RatA of RatAB toxin-antitoxin module
MKSTVPVAVIALVAVGTTACKVGVMRDVRVVDERVVTAPAPSSAPSAAPTESEEARVVAVPVAGSGLPMSRATVLIKAPRARVRAVLLDFEHYPEFMPTHRKCQMLGPNARGWEEVHTDIEVLGGIVHFRVRMEVSPATMVGGVETYEMRFINGNVKGFQARWRLEERGADRTWLTVDSHLEPAIPIPVALMASGSLSGAEDAIVAIKRRAEDPGYRLR